MNLKNRQIRLISKKFKQKLLAQRVYVTTTEELLIGVLIDYILDNYELKDLPTKPPTKSTQLTNQKRKKN